MKANLSADGEKRIDVRVPFRLTKDQVAAALAVYTSRYGDEYGDLKEKEIMRRVRRQLMYVGTDGIDFLDENDVEEDALEWAKEQVERFWQ